MFPFKDILMRLILNVMHLYFNIQNIIYREAFGVCSHDISRVPKTQIHAFYHMQLCTTPSLKHKYPPQKSELKHN